MRKTNHLDYKNSILIDLRMLVFVDNAIVVAHGLGLMSKVTYMPDLELGNGRRLI